MDCPKCIGALQAVEYGKQIHIHRCDTCGGLWCNPDALQEMKATWLAEAVLDTGSPKVGSSLDQVGDILCPEGHGAMLKRYDLKQQHIWYEECPACGGIFLDAGEFTDLKFDTLLDRIRGLVKGPSPLD